MLQLQYTNDGSPTLHNQQLNVTYHSRFGAMQESHYIYIERGLGYGLKTFGNRLQVLEMGYGTGLNAWLSQQEAKREQLSINYIAVEKYPVPQNLYQQLNYANDEQEAEDFERIIQCEWNTHITVDQNFSLIKLHKDINETTLPNNLQVVYFDAFDPISAPDCWSVELFSKLYEAMCEKACLVSFCAKGDVKRMLKSCGFKVEALPGPPGKREMTRAIKP